MDRLTFTQSQNHAGSASVTLGPGFHMRPVRIPHAGLRDSAPGPGVIPHLDVGT